MELLTRIRAGAIVAALVVLAPFAAQADAVLETGTLNGTDPGDTIISTFFTPARYIGAVFTLTKTTQITEVGFGIGCCGGGTAFGEIVAADSDNPLALPSDLAAADLGHTTFNVPFLNFDDSGDVSGALSVVLQPGTYAVVFGTDLFGGTGTAPITSGVDEAGYPTIFFGEAGSDWGPFGNGPARIFVYGNAVPEPVTIALMLAGLLGVAFMARGRSASFGGARA
jgi:hypothetical protein